MNLTNLSLAEFSRTLSSSSPAPGGGSAAAAAGAQGFALIGMAARLSAGRPRFAQVEKEMQELSARADENQERLLSLVERDAAGFNAFMAALSMPKGCRRTEALEQAGISAAEIPLETANLCLAGLQLIPALLEQGNPRALSDMGVASLLLEAGLTGALYNIRINALGLNSPEQKARLLALSAELLAAGQPLAGEVRRQVWQRLS